MDGKTFDEAIKRFATTRLTRLAALRGLAASGVAALTGGRLTTEESGAKKNNNKNEKKVRVCKCPTADATLCTTAKIKKSKARKVAGQACNYKGAYQAGVTDCPALAPGPQAPGAALAPQCTNNND